MVSTIDNIAKGEKISQAFKGKWAVPDVAYYMIVTGESTGQLAEMMSRVSVYYQEQHHNLVTNLKAFIEPVMIVFLAVVVGGIIVFDDYGAFPGANKAIDDFFENNCEVKKLKYSNAIGYIVK